MQCADSPPGRSPAPSGGMPSSPTVAQKLQTRLSPRFILQPLESPMKKSVLAAAAVAAFGAAIPGAAFADLAYNVGAVTDYRYRGISQTRLLGAVQGGVDFSHASGVYAGAWASNIRWVQDAGGSGDIEVDLYGGYKGEIVKGLSYDVGGLFYYYPGNNLKPVTGADANTLEAYGALTFGPATAKVSYALTDTFGNFDSKGSTYVDLSAGFDIGGGVIVTPHVGWQRITGPNNNPGSYVDGSLALSKDFNGLVVSLTGIINRRIDVAFYSSPYNGKSLGRSTLVAGLKYNF
jgi:uncharacterized protein (TIGR02001 family)